MSENENSINNNQDINLDRGLTINEVSDFLDEDPNVIRDWFKDFRSYIPHEKDDNGCNLFKSDGIESFKKIQALHRHRNWNMKQIEHYFSTGGESFKTESEKTSSEMLTGEFKANREELSSISEENKELKERLDNQEGFNKAQIEQFKHLNRGSEERDKAIMLSMKESMEARKLIAAVENADKQKKGFLARLFGK